MRVWINQFSKPGPVTQADQSPIASRIKNRRNASSRSGTSPLLLLVHKAAPHTIRHNYLGFISLIWTGSLVKRNSNTVRVQRPSSGRPAGTIKPGSSAPHRSRDRAGLEQHTFHCVGFYGPHLADPAWNFKLPSRVIGSRQSGPARLIKSVWVQRPRPRVGPPGTLCQVHRPSTGPAWSNALCTAPGSTVLTWPASPGGSSY